MTRNSFLAALGGLALAGAAALAPAPALSQALACGGTYTVKRGDTLSLIARRAYGDVSGYAAIYDANAGRIGGNSSQIEIGMELSIPCLDGTGATAATAGAARPATTDGVTPATVDATKVRQEKTADPLPPPRERVIRILTAGDWAPFLDENLEQGGMFAEIVAAAMQRAEGRPKYKIDFINDRGAHLQPLLSDHAYDLGVAWFRPNCNAVDKLGSDSRFRCTNLNWSEPIFEQIVGYYTRADTPAPESHADLFGSRICRPAGDPTFMLEEKDLVEPNIQLIRPDGPARAFEMLLKGECDVVVLDIDVSEPAIAALGAAGEVTLQEQLNQIASVSVVISRTHPRGSEILAAFDDGLKKIKEDGTWFRIVQRRIAEHKTGTAGN